MVPGQQVGVRCDWLSAQSRSVRESGDEAGGFNARGAGGLLRLVEDDTAALRFMGRGNS
jgi:hypothetical protein